MKSNEELLESLDFGKVDSESEINLDTKFIKTSDFEKFIKSDTALVLGAKGSGKSALFEMFAKYEEKSRVLSGNKVDDVIFATGTGFKDIKELSTDDIQKLMNEENFDFDSTWQLYIAIKVAMQLGKIGYYGEKNLQEFLKQVGLMHDFRILPILKGLWGLIIGTPPSGINLNIKGVSLKLGDKHSIDVSDLLYEINELMEEENKECWILFDKIDELFSNNYGKRKECIESLFRVYLQFIHKYPNIKLKIFLRNDIWSTLNFVNKSHITDKCVELKWDKEYLMKLMLKRACSTKEIEEYIWKKLNIDKNEIFDNNNVEKSFYTIFAEQVYSGDHEAKVIDWIMARITDGLGGKYPRELINFGNISKDIQKRKYSNSFADDFFVCGNAIRDAYFEVSRTKCISYLNEFPHLQKHFERFSGTTQSSYGRKELIKLMKGLEPKGEEMIKQLYEVGILLPSKNMSVNAEKFEIPRLYRSGLGLTIRGRV